MFPHPVTNQGITSSSRVCADKTQLDTMPVKKARVDKMSASLGTGHFVHRILSNPIRAKCQEPTSGTMLAICSISYKVVHCHNFKGKSGLYLNNRMKEEASTLPNHSTWED